MKTNGLMLNGSEINLICDALSQYVKYLEEDVKESSCASKVVANTIILMRISSLLEKIADAVKGAETPTDTTIN